MKPTCPHDWLTVDKSRNKAHIHFATHETSPPPPYRSYLCHTLSRGRRWRKMPELHPPRLLHSKTWRNTCRQLPVASKDRLGNEFDCMASARYQKACLVSASILSEANWSYWVIRYRWQSERTVALKILNSCYAQSASNLLDIEQTVAQKNPSHQGYGVTRHCLESFELKGSDTTHLCLVYEAMREPMSVFQKRFENRRMPLPLAKAYIHLLLLGLQYMHAECRLIHTGK